MSNYAQAATTEELNNDSIIKCVREKHKPDECSGDKVELTDCIPVKSLALSSAVVCECTLKRTCIDCSVDLRARHNANAHKKNI